MPTDIELALQTAVQHHQAGRWREAELLYREVLAQDPHQPNALHLLGVVAFQAKRTDVAIGLVQQALALRPDLAEAHHHLGTMFLATGRPQEALAAFRRALELRPDHAETHLYLAHALKETGQIDGAVEAYVQAVRRGAPVEELFGFATAMSKGKTIHASVAAFKRGLELRPDSAGAWLNYGNALHDTGDWGGAKSAYEKALALQPHYADAQINLGSLYKEIGQIPQGLALFRAALVSDPASVAAQDNILVALNYSDEATPELTFKEAQHWDEIHGRPRRAARPHRNDPAPQRRLRVGYVSADFYTHSCAFFAHPLLAHHDPAQVEIFCYAQNATQDAMTQSLRQAAHHWIDARDLSDDALADRIGADQIDILVDLMGHTSGHRLLVFGRKPAPIQVTYLGYPATTGLAAMDYRLTDAYADPPGLTDPWYTEKLVRLPHTFLTYEPPTFAPAVNALPAPSSGIVTFASFSNLAKISPMVIALWAAILKALPESRLRLKWPHFSYAPTRALFAAAFAAHGIPESRLDLLPGVPAIEGHFAQYHQVDIALDPYPYHGTTTTCEALWMGVPVISLTGPAHVSRVGLSLLSNVGLTEFAAATPQEYVAKAVALGRDLPRLTALRAGLRDRMRASPLLDARQFAQNVERAYRDMWRQWCAQSVHS